MRASAKGLAYSKPVRGGYGGYGGGGGYGQAAAPREGVPGEGWQGEHPGNELTELI